MSGAPCYREPVGTSLLRYHEGVFLGRTYLSASTAGSVHGMTGVVKRDPLSPRWLTPYSWAAPAPAGAAQLCLAEVRRLRLEVGELALQLLPDEPRDHAKVVHHLLRTGVEAQELLAVA